MMSNVEYVKTIAEELEQKGAAVFFDGEDGNEIYDIEYIVDAQLEFLGARAAIAIGGPNIYIDSREGEVDLYWGTEEVHWYLSSSCRIDVDAYFQEIYQMLRS